MAVEKNLFKYDFAVVSIVKDAAENIKEWIEYHMLAGVDHFYIYDNDSYDNIKDILQPYVNSKLVTYIFYPGKNQRIAAYNNAVENFKFECRYMTFLDVSEFLLPKKNQTVVEVTDEIFSGKDNVGGIELNSYNYSAGSQEIPEDGILGRFTRRERNPFEIANTIVNPRKVDYLFNARYATYFDGVFRVNDYSGKVNEDSDETVSDKIIVNSYKKIIEKEKSKPTDSSLDATKSMLESFYRIKLFDDSILKYRKARNDHFLRNYDEMSKKLSGNIDESKLLNVLAKTLLPNFKDYNAIEFFKSKENQLRYFRAISEFYVSAPNEFFQNKMETFLTCFNVSLHLKETILDEIAGRFFVDATLNAICQTLCTEISTSDARLFIRELPKILPLPYQTVEILLSICAGMLDKMKDTLKNSSEEKKNYDIDENEMATWRKFTEIEYLQKLLKFLNVPKNN
ncbi:MAG: glycosyltransferase family 92 protein [Selenomonadaceae bacterium]|nr:glycosyltransferase family 92 protein [Selenomonadaceae bacterium]